MKNFWLDRANQKSDIPDWRDRALGLALMNAKAEIAMLKEQLVELEKTFNKNLDEGYEEAYQMILEERNRANKIEVEIRNEYEKKFKDMKNYIADQVDQYLKILEKDEETAAIVVAILQKRTPAQIVEDAINREKQKE
jgi:hypothetical protein